MVSSCCVKGCSEKFVKGGGISYFRISSKPELQRNAWIAALQRYGWVPKPHHRICSRHFVTGTWNADPNHVDYIPSINMHRDGLDISTREDSPSDYNNSHSLLDSMDINTSPFHVNGAIESAGVSDDTMIPSHSQVPTASHSSSQYTKKKVPVSHGRKSTHRRSLNPKLKSSQFCEHKDAHRICCRVIRELAEENQMLKTQINFLSFQNQRLQMQLQPVLNPDTSLNLDKVDDIKADDMATSSADSNNIDKIDLLGNEGNVTQSENVQKSAPLPMGDIEIVSNESDSLDNMNDHFVTADLQVENDPTVSAV